MAILSISNFGGVIPKIASHLLPDGNASININVIPVDGNLHGVSYADLITPSESQPVSLEGKLRSLYVSAGGTIWGWESKVQVAQIPSGDAAQRYITAGDYAPQVFDDSLGAHLPGKVDLKPTLSFAAGMPRPKERLVWGGDGDAPAEDPSNPNFYAYTFYIRWGGIVYESNLSAPLGLGVTADIKVSLETPTLNSQQIESATRVSGTGNEYRLILKDNHYLVIGDRILFGFNDDVGYVTHVDGNKDVTVRFEADSIFLSNMDISIRRRTESLVLRNVDGDEANTFNIIGMRNAQCVIGVSIDNGDVSDYDITAIRGGFDIRDGMDSDSLMIHEEEDFMPEQGLKTVVTANGGDISLTEYGTWFIYAKRRDSQFVLTRKIKVEVMPLAFNGSLCSYGNGHIVY